MHQPATIDLCHHLRANSRTHALTHARTRVRVPNGPNRFRLCVPVANTGPRQCGRDEGFIFSDARWPERRGWGRGKGERRRRGARRGREGRGKKERRAKVVADCETLEYGDGIADIEERRPMEPVQKGKKRGGWERERGRWVKIFFLGKIESLLFPYFGSLAALQSRYLYICFASTSFRSSSSLCSPPLSFNPFLSPPPFSVITVNSLNDFLPARKGVGVVVPLIPLFCESVFLPPPPSDLFLVSRGDETRPFEQAVLVEQTPRSRERRRRRRKATIQISR